MERTKVDREAALARLAADPVGLAGQLLRESGAAMRAAQVKQQLVALGLDRRAAEAVWLAAQKPLRMSGQVAVEGRPARYRWVGPVGARGREPERRAEPESQVDGATEVNQAETMGTEAMVAEANARAEAAEAEAAMAYVRAEAAMAQARAEAAEQRVEELARRCDQLEETMRQEHAESVQMRAAQQRQLQIDVVRALAELAAEVEELATDQFGPEVLVDRVRAAVGAHALQPIGNSGGTAHFDPDFHIPAFGTLEAGTMATVIRPGYRWRFAGEDVVITKALVLAT